MFAGPEHASYLALCRELLLEREFEEGDCISICWPDGAGGHRASVVSGSDLATNDPAVAGQSDRNGWAQRIYVWIPRLDQWLAMLEEASWTRLRLEIERATGRYIVVPMLADGVEYGYGATPSPTREEAAARLWMSVTGRTVTA